MLLVSYDISDDKLRTHFAKFLSKYGYRLQYSIFEITNSPKILENVKTEIENRFKKKFGQSDSVIIFQLSNSCKAHCQQPVLTLQVKHQLPALPPKQSPCKMMQSSKATWLTIA